MAETDWSFIIWNGICGLCSLALVMSYAMSSSFRTPTLTKVCIMSVCHLGLVLKFLLVRAVPGHIIDRSLTCQLAGTADAFLLQATLGWQFCLAVGLWSSLTNVRVSIYYQHFYVWSIAVISSVSGWTLDLYSPAYDKEDCWFSLGLPRLFILIPLVCYMAFGIYLMVYAAWRMRSIHVALAKRRQILKRMSFFVGVFIITLLPEVIHVIWTMFRVAVVGISDPDVESPLEEIAAYGVVACGLGNLLVWSSTPAFRRSYCCCFRQCAVGPRASSIKLPLTEETTGANGKRVDGYKRALIARPTLASKGDRPSSGNANDNNDNNVGDYVAPVARMSNINYNGDAPNGLNKSDPYDVLRRYTRHGGIVAGGGGGTGIHGFHSNSLPRNESNLHNPYGLPTGDTPVSSLHNDRHAPSLLIIADDESSISDRRGSHSQSHSSQPSQSHSSRSQHRYDYSATDDNAIINSITIPMMDAASGSDDDSSRRASTTLH